MKSETEHSAPAGRVLVFDSGMGGLTVAAEIAAIAPQLVVDYAADTGFFPYGDKSDAALRTRLPQVAEALVAVARPDVFVIACNTASTLALDEVRARLDIPVVGTVPAIKPAAGLSASKVIGLLATPGTISRPYTARLIAQFAAGCRVLPHGSIDLVRAAEAHAAGERIDAERFRQAQAPMFAAPLGDQIDTVVLACTHFPLVRDQLAASAPRPVVYIDSGPAIARQTLRILPTGANSVAGAGPARAFATSGLDSDARLVRVLARFGYRKIETVAVSERAGNAGDAGA